MSKNSWFSDSEEAYLELREKLLKKGFGDLHGLKKGDKVQYYKEARPLTLKYDIGDTNCFSTSRNEYLVRVEECSETMYASWALRPYKEGM